MTSSLHGIGELIAYLPYQLGFLPRDCLVVIGLRDRRTVLTARFDRPDSCDAVAFAKHIATTFGRHDPDELVVLCYDASGAADQLFLQELGDLLRAAGAVLSHVAHVRGEAATWRAERCSCHRCPCTWSPVPPATGVAPVAEQVLRGVTPAADRADLAHRFDVRHPLVAAAVGHRLGEPAEVHSAEVLPRVLLEQQTPVHQLPVDVLADATTAVAAIVVRDQVLSWLMPQFLPAELVEAEAPVDPHHLGLPPLWLRELDPFDDPVDRVAERLEEWVGCIPQSWSVPVLLLAAAIRWVTGNGVLASFAVDRALQVEPDCRLAQLFDAALQAGLRPTPAQQRPA
ncbi:DUF4192 domain-containing protein [Flexivirga lutea]